MKGLFRKRGGGKTTALVYTSAITGYPIVVPTTMNIQESFIVDLGVISNKINELIAAVNELRENHE